MLNSVLKRFADIVVAGILLVSLAPLFLVVALAIKLDTPGPVIYSAERVGWKLRPFRMLKFRSMYVDADKVGPQVTGARDSRVTRVGNLLRRYKLDELPQLINVLRGDMSLVGPRPEDPAYIKHYGEAAQTVFSVRPGIAGPGQLYYYLSQLADAGAASPEAYYLEQQLPRKIALDVEYARHPTVVRDIGLLLRCVMGVLRGARRENHLAVSGRDRGFSG